MNQKKVGSFMKELRKEKGFTQERLAEEFQVSGRTVSRWENGNNMPDLDILIEISDFYDVDLRELLNGERKSGKMNEELKETVLMVADYSNEEKQKITRRMHFLFIGGFIAAVVYMILLFTGHEDNFLGGFCLGITLGMMVVGVIMTSKYAMKMRNLKMRIWKKFRRTA